LDDDFLGLDIPELLGVWGKSTILNKTETLTYISSYTQRFFCFFSPASLAVLRQYSTVILGNGEKSLILVVTLLFSQM